MNVNNKPIGIFDSGLGGLTVLKEIKKVLPNESFIYFGDTAHLPYGNKSEKAITQYSLEISNFLISKNIKSLIIACNTASSVAFEILKETLEIPVFDVIDPSIEETLKTTKTKNVAVIGTETTINSQAYQRKIQLFDKTIKVVAQPCPLFVPLVEEGLVNHKFAYEITKFYLRKLINTKIDTLILGCTHYPLIIKTIKQVITKNIKTIDSSKTIAKHIKKTFLKNNTQANSGSSVNTIFYVTDKPKKFDQLAKIFLKNEKIKVNHIIL